MTETNKQSFTQCVLAGDAAAGIAAAFKAEKALKDANAENARLYLQIKEREKEIANYFKDWAMVCDGCKMGIDCDNTCWIQLYECVYFCEECSDGRDDCCTDCYKREKCECESSNADRWLDEENK